MINHGALPYAIVAHYDWLQDSQYCNQSLVDFATSPLLEIGRSI